MKTCGAYIRALSISTWRDQNTAVHTCRPPPPPPPGRWRARPTLPLAHEWRRRPRHGPLAKQRAHHPTCRPLVVLPEASFRKGPRGCVRGQSAGAAIPPSPRVRTRRSTSRTRKRRATARLVGGQLGRRLHVGRRSARAQNGWSMRLATHLTRRKTRIHTMAMIPVRGRSCGSWEELL